MRDKALLGLMVLLAGMGVLVDFTSAILSVLGDLIMMGAAVACAIFVYRHLMERIAGLEAANATLRAQISAQEIQPGGRFNPLSQAPGIDRGRMSVFGRMPGT